MLPCLTIIQSCMATGWSGGKVLVASYDPPYNRLNGPLSSFIEKTRTGKLFGNWTDGGRLP